MPGSVLHILSQRPARTGSGVTLEALVRQAGLAGWAQHAVVGTPVSDPAPKVGELSEDRVHPLIFGRGELNFRLPGMSDVMPYPSSRFSALNPRQIDTYLRAWRDHLKMVIQSCRPDLIHTHHIWLVSALVKDISPNIPVVTQSHATGLRQMALCPHLAEQVKAGCRRNDRFFVLHKEQAAALSRLLDVPPERIHGVGVGYQARLFRWGEEKDREAHGLLYAGKYSHSKGLPWLLDAVEKLAGRFPGLKLHVAGSGSGPEAESLARRMRAMSPVVERHGHLDQSGLADLMRRCSVFVLPSFSEGLPLVLVEALACGCRLVSTRLPGVMDQLAPDLDPVLHLVPLPRMSQTGGAEPEDPVGFVEGLKTAIEKSLAAPPPRPDMPGVRKILVDFTWSAVFKRIEPVWRGLIRAEPEFRESSLYKKRIKW